MAFVLTLVGVLFVLLFAEFLARRTNLHAEITRKFVHMIVGTFVAFWPFFLSWTQIEIISAMMFIVVVLSVKFTIFKSIHTVPRNAIGEICFAAVIGILALISNEPWVFTAAMLCLSIGDGLAAIVGLLFGDGNRYKVFGKTKSIAGTGAFLAVSLLTAIVYTQAVNDSANLIALVVMPILATITENVAVNGTDNLIMPVLIALILSGTA